MLAILFLLLDLCVDTNSVYVFKLLGVTLYPDLRLSEHISQVLATSIQRLYFICQLQKSLPVCNTDIVFNAFVLYFCFTII